VRERERERERDFGKEGSREIGADVISIPILGMYGIITKHIFT
jgi:hypothetical protein